MCPEASPAVVIRLAFEPEKVLVLRICKQGDLPPTRISLIQ